MRIKNYKNKTIPFKEIKAGTVFRYPKDEACNYCIKLERAFDVVSGFPPVTAISLVDGSAVYMNDSDGVIVLNVELIDLDKEN